MSDPTLTPTPGPHINWRQVEHLAIAGICVVLGVLAHFGIQLPGITVDPNVAMTFGLGAFTGGVAKGKLIG